jgi:hypothetical protein
MIKDFVLREPVYPGKITFMPRTTFVVIKEKKMTTKRHVPSEEYAILRTLESLTNSMFRVEVTSLKQLKQSWLWSAMQEQCKSLIHFRAVSKMSEGGE